MMDKQKMVYVGVALFAFLVIVNSTKKVVLEEVTSENTSIPDNDDLKSELIKKIIDVNNKPFDNETDDEFKERMNNK